MDEEEALTQQLNVRVSPRDLEALESVTFGAFKKGTVARIALRLGIQQILDDPTSLLHPPEPRAKSQDKPAKKRPRKRTAK